MRRLCTIALLSTLGAAGCDFDFAGIQSDTPAQLNVQLHAIGPNDELRLAAALLPGTDVDGRRRQILSDLIVIGDSITPSPMPAGMRYDAIWPLSSVQLPGGLIRITAPEIAGLPEGPHVVAMPMPIRTGGDTIRLAAGADIVIRLETEPLPQDVQSHWQLVARDTMGQLQFITSVIGELPDEIRIPASFLGLGAHPIGSVEVVSTHHQTGELIPGLYTVAVGVNVEQRWIVRWEQ